MAITATPILVSSQVTQDDEPIIPAWGHGKTAAFRKIKSRLRLTDNQLLEIAGSTTTAELQNLLVFMDDYIAQPHQSEWLSTPLSAFSGLTARQLILQGRTHELLVETERLREGIPA